jgi:hypothetical protein
MNEPLKAYPLTWPAGWRRCPPAERARATFAHYKARLSIGVAVERVLTELELMGVDTDANVVVSTNVPLRLDGFPRSDRDLEPQDPGAAVYWRNPASATNKFPCIPIDQYDRVADNLGAIAATLEALRRIERHGGARILERAFLGLTALPAPEQWFQVLELSVHATAAEIREAAHRLAFKHHPDRPGGDTHHMARINAARDEGLSRLRGI